MAKVTAKSLYKKVWPLFEGAGADDAVQGTVRDLCWYTVEILKLQDEIASLGSVVETPSGRKPNPACALLHTYMADKNACLKCLMPLVERRPARDELMDFLAAGR